MGAGMPHAAASARPHGGVHVRVVRVSRPRARDRDDGRQRAGRAGARPVHLSADAHHRRRRRAAREPARLGAASRGVFSRALRRRNNSGDGDRAGTRRRALRDLCADGHRPGGHGRGREDVPVGFGGTVRDEERQGMGRPRARVVGRGGGACRSARPRRRSVVLFRRVISAGARHHCCARGTGCANRHRERAGRHSERHASITGRRHATNTKGPERVARDHRAGRYARTKRASARSCAISVARRATARSRTIDRRQHRSRRTRALPLPRLRQWPRRQRPPAPRVRQAPRRRRLDHRRGKP